MDNNALKNEYRIFLGECIDSYNIDVNNENGNTEQLTPKELFDEGRKHLYGRGGVKKNVEKGLELLDLSANGDFEPALMELLNHYMKRKVDSNNAQLVHDYLRQLVSKHNSVFAMIHLGGIYCASPNNQEIINFPKLKVFEDKHRGIALINKGYEQSKKNGTLLDCMTYENMIEAYFHVKHTGKQDRDNNKDVDCPFWSQGHKSFERLVLLLKENILALRESRGLSANYPEEAKKAMLSMNLRSLGTIIKPQEIETWKATWK